MRVADFVIQYLESRGINHAFTVCGGGSIFLNDAMRKAARMRYTAMHHEQACSMAAEAYARVTGSVGLCVVTSGPGATNAITGVAGAWMDHVPVLVLSGQAFSTQTINGHPGLRQMGIQEINIVDIIKPITKYAVMVRSPEMIRAHLEHALWAAREGRPGPVWIDVPADIQNAQIDQATLAGFEPPPVAKHWLKVDEVVAMLRAAKRPLIHVGQGVRLAGAIPEFMKFVESCGLPFITARNANDICGSDHANYIGRAGTFAQRGANFAVQTCDFYLAIGTRLSLAQTGYNAKDYARNAKIAMVDIDAAELAKDTVRVDLPIQADASEFINALARASLCWFPPAMEFWHIQDAYKLRPTDFPDWSAWLAQCKAWQEKYPIVTQAMREESEYVNSYVLADTLSDLLTPDDVIVTDVGFAYQTTMQAWKVKLGQRLIANNGLAGMGYGLPAAIGACIASGKRTICITGDGGFMFNSQELATIAHHKLPIKIFILNNGGYLTMRQSQDNAFDGQMGSGEDTGISFPDFETLAAAHGIRFNSIENRAEYSEWKHAIEMEGPMITELMMHPNQESMHVINKREADGTIRQTPIEDAYPYLDPAEIAEQLRIGM